MSDNQPTGDTSQTGTTDGADTTATENGSQTQATKVEPEKKPNFSGDFDPDRAARALAGSRADTAKQKERADALEAKFAALAKALGGGDDEKPDPDQLTKQLSTTQAEGRQVKVENAILRRAGKAGADAEMLLDSRTFLGTVEGLDPSSATFLDDVEAAIKKAIKDNPRYKTAGTGAARAGVELNGSGPDGKNKKATSLEDALAGRI